MIDQKELQYKQRADNYVTGSAFNHAVVPNRYSYFSLANQMMSGIRNANNFRPRLFALPDSSVFGTTGIAPFTDYTSQIRMLPGTQVVGYSLGFITFGEVPTDSPLYMENAFYLSLMDDSTGIPFFSDFLSEIFFNINVAYTNGSVSQKQVYVAKKAWMPLTRPHPILAPGIVTMTFSYKGSLTDNIFIAPQVLLVCAEPCGAVVNLGECQ